MYKFKCILEGAHVIYMQMIYLCNYTGFTTQLTVFTMFVWEMNTNKLF